ncbi:glycoside hydrolase family 5 protein [Poronia punctata]|nr:glycoside hydrolase family 5 protein [Poronia punctata]
MLFSGVISLAVLPAVFAKVQLLGVSVGAEHGRHIDGTRGSDSVRLPLSGVSEQMTRFIRDDGMNLLRLPTSWQFLANDKLGGSLDISNLSQYDQLVQSCLATGAHCMISINNSGRWNGNITEQTGPTDGQLANFWGDLASRYAAHDNIIFELINESRHLSVSIGAETCRKAVTAIRDAGATSQMILLPGIDIDSATTVFSRGKADTLLAITNPNGSTDDLVLGIRTYLDQDNSGTHRECTADNIDALATVAEYLRERGRKGLISWTGASGDSYCLASLCAQTEFINMNSDVFTGLVAAGAAGLNTSSLSITPSYRNGQVSDTNLRKQCLLGTWSNSHRDNNTKATQAAGMKDLESILGSGTLILSSVLQPEPTVLLTATLGPVVSTNGSITSAGGVLTDILPQATLTTLEVATEPPPSGSGIAGLLTGSDSPSPTQSLPGNDASSSGSSSIRASSGWVRLFFIWGCVCAAIILTE